MNKYPTKEEILKDIVLDTTKLDILLKWKKKWYKQWSTRNNLYQNKAIKSLIIKLTKGNLPQIAGSDRFAYLSDFKTILVDTNKPSIISTLHETAHHLYGPEELLACQWSIQIFRKCFPKSFQKLKWNGYLLIK